MYSSTRSSAAHYYHTARLREPRQRTKMPMPYRKFMTPLRESTLPSHSIAAISFSSLSLGLSPVSSPLVSAKARRITHSRSACSRVTHSNSWVPWSSADSGGEAGTSRNRRPGSPVGNKGMSVSLSSVYSCSTRIAFRRLRHLTRFSPNLASSPVRWPPGCSISYGACL